LFTAVIAIISCSPQEQLKRHLILDTHPLERTTSIRSEDDFLIQEFRITHYDARTGVELDVYTHTRKPKKPWTWGCFRASVVTRDGSGVSHSFTEQDFLPPHFDESPLPCPPDPIFRKLHSYPETRILVSAYLQNASLKFAGLSDTQTYNAVILGLELCRKNWLTSSCLPVQFAERWPFYFRGEMNLQFLTPGDYSLKNLRFLPNPEDAFKDSQPEQFVLAPQQFCFTIHRQNTR
jgi:hypothetical protein